MDSHNTLIDHLLHIGKIELKPIRFKKVGVALSGGPDSVLLAVLLKSFGYEFIAMHCNFHLRGEESMRDQRFVEDFCGSNDIELFIKHFNTTEYINHFGQSVELGCRELRYGWFEEMQSDKGLERIALGHNADDNIETFFLNMLRGCGTRGLKGMEIDNGKLWRPLLNIHRDEIIQLLKDFNQSFIIDSTNLKSDYRRNFLRNQIIPLLKSEWKGFNSALDSTIRNIKSENFLIEEILKNELLDKTVLKQDQILKFPDPGLLIKRYIDELNPFKNTHNEILKAIHANKPHIRKWRLRNGEVILRNKKLYKNRL